MKRTQYHVGGFVATAVAQNRLSEFDSVSNTYTTWDESGAQLSQRQLTNDEVFQLGVEQSAGIKALNAEAIRTRAKAALADNATFLASPAHPVNPTTAQRDQAITALIAEAKRSARQRNGIIRLLLNELDDASDA